MKPITIKDTARAVREAWGLESIITDEAHTLKPESRARLMARLQRYQDKTGVAL